MITEIVILAMIAAFLGLRLYSVLGRRSEHEEEIVPRRFERSETPPQSDNAPQAVRQPVVLRSGDERAPANETGIRAIAAADQGFDLLGFLEGAKFLRFTIMKIRNSLKSAKLREKGCRIVRRRGRVYVINKKNPRFKARQG